MLHSTVLHYVVATRHEKEVMNTARKIGRDAGTGKFIPVKTARIRKGSAVVETLRSPPKKKK
jgi:hypothetical protein